ncbi:YcaO-like family protein [Haloarcula litorea]|uniref:YcaO-like family protein n=1 Tax=Haloarcula litorea TaxID=3032579 RepID=UPI0023E80D74|nr:YcaO-like family protein [Halomicroarcula sp. GDY20]
MTTVELVGTGPAADAVRAALAETSAETVERGEPLPDDRPDLSVVVDGTGSEVFRRADRRAAATATPWVAVELGGVGGVPVTEAAVAGFAPGTACYDCLRTRVRANVDETANRPETPDAGTRRFAGAVAGRRIEQALTGEGALAGSVVELPYTERRVLPVPGCDCDDGGRGWRLQGRAADHEADALARAEGGLDERVGVVGEVGEAESFPAPYYLASLSDTGGFSDATASPQAAGVAVDWDTAFMKALGESYERYAAGVYRTADLRRGTADDVDGAVSPSAFVAPDGAADAGEPLHWAPAERLEKGEQRWLPASVILYPPPERAVRPPVTTGLGLGSTEREALLSGLTEVIERDAAMLSWYSTVDPLGIAVEDSERFDTLRRRARSEDLDVTTLLLTQDVDVPVVAVALERDEWPRFALGSAADLDPEAAAVGALEEALQNWMELRGMGREEAAEADGAIGRYAREPGPATALTEPETTVPLSSVGPDSVPEGAAALSALVDRAVEAGLSPYATRLTTRDLEQMGFEAVRVCCPTAQPLFFGDAYFGERARRVPADLGYEARLDRPHHPFP